MGVGSMRRRRLATLFGFRPRVALAVGSRTKSIRETDKGGKERERERNEGTNERVRKERWLKVGKRGKQGWVVVPRPVRQHLAAPGQAKL